MILLVFFDELNLENYQKMQFVVSYWKNEDLQILQILLRKTIFSIIIVNFTILRKKEINIVCVVSGWLKWTVHR